MIHCIIEIVLGYVMWKYLPGKITAAKPKVRGYIDLGLQIVGIILMILGSISLFKNVVHLIF